MFLLDAVWSSLVEGDEQLDRPVKHVSNDALPFAADIFSLCPKHNSLPLGLLIQPSYPSPTKELHGWGGVLEISPQTLFLSSSERRARGESIEMHLAL